MSSVARWIGLLGDAGSTGANSVKIVLVNALNNLKAMDSLVPSVKNLLRTGKMTKDQAREAIKTSSLGITPKAAALKAIDDISLDGRLWVVRDVDAPNGILLDVKAPSPIMVRLDLTNVTRPAIGATPPEAYKSATNVCFDDIIQGIHKGDVTVDALIESAKKLDPVIENINPIAKQDLLDGLTELKASGATKGNALAVARSLGLRVTNHFDNLAIQGALGVAGEVFCKSTPIIRSFMTKYPSTATRAAKLDELKASLKNAGIDKIGIKDVETLAKLRKGLGETDKLTQSRFNKIMDELNCDPLTGVHASAPFKSKHWKWLRTYVAPIATTLAALYFLGSQLANDIRGGYGKPGGGDNSSSPNAGGGEGDSVSLTTFIPIIIVAVFCVVLLGGGIVVFFVMR